MAKKTGLAQYHALAKKYEKKTGKKPTGMKLDDLKAFFKKTRKKTKTKKSTKSSGSGNGVAEIFAQDW